MPLSNRMAPAPQGPETDTDVGRVHADGPPQADVDAPPDQHDSHGGQRVSLALLRCSSSDPRRAGGAVAAKPRAGGGLRNACAAVFGSADLGLELAAHGAFTLMPPPAMCEALSADYAA